MKKLLLIICLLSLPVLAQNRVVINHYDGYVLVDDEKEGIDSLGKAYWNDFEYAGKMRVILYPQINIQIVEYYDGNFYGLKEETEISELWENYLTEKF